MFLYNAANARHDTSLSNIIKGMKFLDCKIRSLISIEIFSLNNYFSQYSINIKNYLRRCKQNHGFLQKKIQIYFVYHREKISNQC